MCDLLVCRVCLASDDVKLYNIYKFNLIEAYKNVIGDQVRINLFLILGKFPNLKNDSFFFLNINFCLQILPDCFEYFYF